MNQVPISECYLPKCNITTTSLSPANSIHMEDQICISTQNGISNSDTYYFTCNTGIQDLYVTNYKYTINSL